MGGGGLGDHDIWYVLIIICEAASLEKIYIPLVGLSGGSLDAYEQVAIGVYVKRLVVISSG